MKYLVLCVFLAGCCTAPKEVKIPVPVKCTTPDPEKPQYRFSPPYDNIFDAVKDLLGDREVSLAYEHSQEVALKSCK